MAASKIAASKTERKREGEYESEKIGSLATDSVRNLSTNAKTNNANPMDLG